LIALSEASPTPEPAKPGRRGRRRLIKLAASLFLFATFLTGALVLFALQNLNFIAQWSISRLLPGASAKLERVELHNWNEIRVRKLEIKSDSSGATLLRLEGGRMLFAYDEVLSGRLREVELIAPEVTASADLFALFAKPQTDNPPVRRAPPGWSVNRLRIDNARFDLPASPELPLNIDARFSIDWENLDFRSDTPRELVIDEVRAVWAGREIVALKVEKIIVGLSVDGLFAKRRIESVRVTSGVVEIDADGWEAFRSIQLVPKTTRGAAQDAWVVGRVDLGQVGVHLSRLSGALQSIDFKVTGTLHEVGNLSAGATPSLVKLSAIQVASEENQTPPVLSADEVAVHFTFDGIMAQKLDFIEITHPSIHIRNELTAATAKPSPPRGGKMKVGPAALPEWHVARVASKYGEFHYDPPKPGEPFITTRFAFDLHDLATAGDLSHQLHDLIIWDLQLRDAPEDERPILTVDSAGVQFSVAEVLTKKTIHSIQANGGRLRIGENLAALLAARKTPDVGTPEPASAAPDSGWKVNLLTISGIRTRLDDNRPGVSDIFLTINTELKDVPLSLAAVDLLDEVRTLEFADVEIRSPVNREIRILKLRSVFVRFTINELLRNQIRQVTILRPTIYLNQDLFIYMERATAKSEAAEPAQNPTNWTIQEVETKFGRLVIGSGAGDDVGLPLGFESRLQDLSFDRLADLKIDAALQIPKQSYQFKSYQIELDSVEGNLRFSYPPEKGVQNLVQKLDIEGIRWRQFEAGMSWLAVTFDRQGINGQFGGEAYNGYINGGFSFFFQNDSPWIGWVSGEGVNTASITDVISPQNFQMSGPMDFEIQLDAFSKKIDRVIGKFSITEPGAMRITKMDDLLGRIPGEWPAIKASSTRIALETLRDYAYTEAGGNLWFVQSQGVLKLNLAGPAGNRDFEVVLHDGDASQGLWQDQSWGKR
jgi:hypothetical protein